MTTKSTIEFTAKNVKAFTTWLKRFSSIDNSLLLEIDQNTNQFIAKTYNEERSVVKMSAIAFDEAGLTTKTSKDSKRIKVGIFNISRLTKVIDQFNEDEFNFVIEYGEIVSDSDSQYAAEKILLKNKSLKMNIDCTSLNIFKYIPDKLFKENIANVDAIGAFELTKSNIEKINTLNNLDSEYKFMEFKMNNGSIVVCGKSYELDVASINNKATSEVNIFKDQYSAIDIENYDVEMGDDRMVFKSKDGDTTTVISKAEKND